MQQATTTFGDFLNSFVNYFLPISGLFFAWFYTVLKEPETKQEYIEKLENFYFLSFYRYWLKNILNKIDKHLGKPEFSKKFIIENLLFHYVFAILYVLIVFLIIWLLGGSNTIGALEMLPKNDSLSGRFIAIGILLFIIIFYYIYLMTKKDLFHIKLVYFFKKILKNDYKIVYRIILASFFSILNFFNHKDIISSIELFVLFFMIKPHFLIIFTLIMVLIYVVFQLLVYGIGITLALLIFSLFTLVLSRRVRQLEVLIIYSVILLLISEGGKNLFEGHSFIGDISSSLLIFFLIIPFFNAILDFISLTISRYLSQKIADGESVFLIVCHLFADLLLALIFFVGLAFILYYGIELFNTLVDAKLQIPIKEMLTDTIKEPFALKNAWITFMLLSTLIPTLLHILLALTSFLLQITNLAPFYANLIEESEQRETKKMKTAIFMTVPTTIIFMIILYGVYRLYLLFV